jgi:hypothetical protein
MRRFLPCLFFLLSLYVARAQRDCRNQEYQQQLLATHPGLSAAYAGVESFTKNLRFNVLSGISGSGSSSSVTPAVITIPVVVHILYNNSSPDIPDAQVLSQIDVLNNDFSGNNTDRGKVPAYFAPFAADCGFRFALAKVDPVGKATNGIVRKQTSIQYFSYDDRAKSSDIGGDGAWDADRYLNIWVCNTVGGLLGYSSLPGAPKDKDGVVISKSVFGTINTSSPYNKGRTTVHEIGHWLNLRHIWGDAYCGDDYVDDTPPQQRANRGCPGGEQFTCGSTTHGDMYMNYMDFTDDACMFMFTWGQKERMRALFAPGGPRYALLSSPALSGQGLPVDSSGLKNQAAEPVMLSLYPNPTTSIITIGSQYNQDCIGKTCNIYNYMGQLVKSTILQSHRQTVDISRLQNGLYFIKVEGMRTTAVARFVKE